MRHTCYRERTVPVGNEHTISSAQDSNLSPLYSRCIELYPTSIYVLYIFQRAYAYCDNLPCAVYTTFNNDMHNEYVAARCCLVVFLEILAESLISLIGSCMNAHQFSSC